MITFDLEIVQKQMQGSTNKHYLVVNNSLIILVTGEIILGTIRTLECNQYSNKLEKAFQNMSSSET